MGYLDFRHSKHWLNECGPHLGHPIFWTYCTYSNLIANQTRVNKLFVMIFLYKCFVVSQSYKSLSHLTAFCNTWTSKFHSSNALRGFEDFYDPVREDVLQTGRAWTVADLRRKVN